MTIDNVLNLLLLPTPDLQSMQMYDVMALAVNQHTQIQTLATMLLNVVPLKITVTAAQTVITVSNVTIATVTRDTNNTILTFTERYISNSICSYTATVDATKHIVTVATLLDFDITLL